MHRSRTAGPDRPVTRDLRPLLRLLTFVWPYRWRVLAAVLALLVAAGAVLAIGQVFRAVVDSGLADGSTASLDRALALFLTVVVVLAGSILARSYLLNWLGERVVADLRRAVFDRVLGLDVGFFEATRTGEIISRLTGDTALLQVVVGSTLAVALRTSLLLIGGVAMLALTSPTLTGLVLLGTPVVVIPLWLLGYRVRRLSRASQDRIADVGAYADEVLHGIRTVQAFCHQGVDRHRYGERAEAAFGVALRRSRMTALLAGAAVLFTFGAVGIVLWFGGREVLAGRMSGGELSAFVFYAVLVASSVGTLSEVVGDLLRGAGAAERLIELLDRRSAILPPQRPILLPAPPEGRLVVEGLTFAYPSHPDAPVLADLSLAVSPGERVALVGPSGAGKTTLFQLLLRFYDPQQGLIRFDGVDLRALALDDLRGRIAIVPQDPVIFGDDAWENIRYGLDVDDTAVRRVADAAHATEFLDRLPDGFSTYLGERGVRLSGGQRQRIAIARALLRDPTLLLLDEATSALDAESEHLVQKALETLMRGRTTLVIAHRLATVRMVDRILVLERGRIIASGSHADLMAEGGLYARLAALQFRDTVRAEEGRAATERPRV
ncbi:MAG: ABC transporter transmembrane domain-containing protein [Chromatiaceae bacterium]|jgi:ATP-binding cassette subfamily B protein|nr:ABC transporter transmembrane domain-containing protein [Chromatiaceae bacterium]